MRLGILVLVAAAATAACSTAPPADIAQPRQRVGQNVEVGADATAPVGGVIFSQFDYQVVRRAVLQDSYSFSQVRLRPGDLLYPAITVGGRQGWCAGVLCFYDGRPATTEIGYTGRFNRMNFGHAVAGDSVVDIGYKVEEVPMGRGFRYDLLYQGFDRGVVRVTYREFNDSLARPAFQQDLSYTLNASNRPTQVSFRNVRLEITGADNNAIRYRVLTPFQ